VSRRAHYIGIGGIGNDPRSWGSLADAAFAGGSLEMFVVDR